ncbi:MAG: hypothetical protein QOJ16_2603 [Acidobacteriota bacterium]|jgi:hypothetical protein|nr:hypothetical protein [Acidobacteriota bacterium]
MSQAVAKQGDRSAKVKRSSVLDVDRSEEFQWLKENAQTYSGRWVAVSGNELVADALTLEELLKETSSRVLARRPLVHRLP